MKPFDKSKLYYLGIILLRMIEQYLSNDDYYSLLEFFRKFFKLEEEIHRYLIDSYECNSKVRNERQIAKSKSNQVNLNFKIPKIVMNSLPESQRRDLSEQRKRWRNEGSDIQVIVKTYYFGVRHFWGSGSSEVGKHIRGFLLNRWI